MFSKKVLTILCSSILVLSGCGSASPPSSPAVTETSTQTTSQQTTTEPKQEETPATPEVVVQIHENFKQAEGMEEVKVSKDIQYKEESGQDSLADIYYPPNMGEQEKLPVVVYVHGDGPGRNLKESEHYESWARLTAASGMIAVMFNHQFASSSNKSLSETGSDIDAMLNYIQQNADELKIDKDRVAIWACSYGNTLGLKTPLKDRPAYIKAIASYYGRLDIRPVGEILFKKSSEKEHNDFSAITHLETEPEKIPPILIAKAGTDGSDLNETIDAFIAKAKEKNVPIEFYEHPEGQHGFDYLNKDETSKEIIMKTIQFFQKHLKQ